ncbi:MAG: paraquat-inducible protein B [Nitrosomonas sp.]|nr:MAG: paraquat-inducible protein B [Nitrosomonas sp.]
MSKKSNPTLIGIFVVGATALLALGVTVFGGAKLFAKKEFYVAYFTENTQGLRVGSNVAMNGVNIGQVSDMVLLLNRDTFQGLTEVTMEIRPESWVVMEGGVPIGSGQDTLAPIPHEKVIQVGGLRAQLQSESLVTGQLLVGMTFQPDTEAVMRGGASPPHPEIPTIPSTTKKIMADVQGWVHELSKDFDAQIFSQRIQNIMQGVDELVNSPELRASLAGADKLINKRETQHLSVSLQEALTEFRGTISDFGLLVRNVDARVNTDLIPLIEKIDTTLDEAQQALAAVKLQLNGESVQAYQLGETLREVEAAARATREFLDYMERNPEAVLQGKKK